MTTKPTGHDPGWNDPPTFSYDKATQIQAKAEKKGLALNKRVAFPLTGTLSRPNSTGIDPTIPPSPINIQKIGAPPVGSPPTSQSLLNSASIGEPPTDLGKENCLTEVLENFESVHSLDSGDEISKRVKIMEKLWRDGKFNPIVQLQLLELSKALREGDVTAADHVQKRLMVDHVSVCSTFMGGIRQLINLRREQEHPCSNLEKRAYENRHSVMTLVRNSFFAGG